MAIRYLAEVLTVHLTKLCRLFLSWEPVLYDMDKNK